MSTSSSAGKRIEVGTLEWRKLIGRRLFDARVKAGLSLRKAAGAAGFRTHHSIMLGELGVCEIRLSRLLALCAACGVTINQILEP